MNLTEEQLERYSRQIILTNFGKNAQRKLLQSSVLCVGAGGLGSAALIYLAAAGVGRIGVIDSDKVELSNLHRQVMHSMASLGRPKVDSARDRILALNPDVTVEVYEERLNSTNAMEIIPRYDAVVDASDNFPTRFLINDACFFAKRPLFFGTVLRYEGQATVFFPASNRSSPCYRCLFPEPPKYGQVASTDEVGVLGTVAGLIGIVQATECIKYLAGVGSSLLGRMLIYEALGMTFRCVTVQRDRRCRLCGEEPTITSLVQYDSGQREGTN